MAEKITWLEPEDTTVTTVEISRSTGLYGSYSVIDTIDATSDGNAKSSSNSWVTSYTDSTGAKTHWYRIRFYDGTNYSDYADPTTSQELLRLCSVDDVKNLINTVGRWTDDEIFKVITDVDQWIYIDAGTPIQSSWSIVGKLSSVLQPRYYVGEENLYRIDRVFYGTTTKVELFLDDQYKQNLRYGMVEVLSVASSGITLADNTEIEVHYVPKIYNELAKYETAKRLLEQIDTMSGGQVSKELAVINQRLASIEKRLMDRIAVQLSSDVARYDSIYGVNRKEIKQDHDRNLYVGSYGWESHPN